MAEKWYIDTIKNSKWRKLLNCDAPEIISWVNGLFDCSPDQYDEDWFVNTMDNIINEQEEFFNVDFNDFSKNQALTVVAKIVQLFDKDNRW